MNIGKQYLRGAMALALGLSVLVGSKASANLNGNPIINGCEHTQGPYAPNWCTKTSGWNMSGTASNTFSVLVTASGTMYAQLLCKNPESGAVTTTGQSSYTGPMQGSFPCPPYYSSRDLMNHPSQPVGSVCGPAMTCASDSL